MVPLAVAFQENLMRRLGDASGKALINAIDTLERSLNGRLDV